MIELILALLCSIDYLRLWGGQTATDTGFLWEII